MKLTQKLIDGLRLPSGKTAVTHWDDDVSGLGHRIQGKKRTWIVRYRPSGESRQRQITLAPVASMPVKKARQLAGEYIAVSRQGRDLAAERKAESEADRRKREAGENSRVGKIADRYLKDVESRLKPQTFSAERRYLMKNWAGLHDRLAGELSIPEIRRELERMRTVNGPFAANRVHEALSRAFIWAVQCGYLPQNPLFGLKPLSPEPPRERVLNLGEIAAVWKGSADLGEYGVVIRLLMLTGCRRAEIGDMSWDEVDLEGRVWTLPSTRSKNGRVLQIPLSDQALAELLSVQPKSDRGRLFGRNKGKGFTGWVRNKRLLDEASGVDGWVLHDIRRSAVTQMAEMGIAPHVVEAVVNHVSGHKSGVAGIYNRATYAAEKKHALQAWADTIEAVASGEAAPSNVVAMASASA
ncbi:MAG: tyrosine-type recombinase/integrase [Alphaproteobacteria bacterium]|nr:tyrosine-type recombinase/integrase [Alphaproteobacteria bacterium]